MSTPLVIKCGGSTMEQLPDAFFQAIAEAQQIGQEIVIVHGGGPAINNMLAKLEIPARFVDGLRVTCEQTIQVVEMVLVGALNKWLVRRIHQAGGKAWGLSGMDGSLITARQTGKPLGQVGEIMAIETAPIRTILTAGYIPVIAPLGLSPDGQTVYNINADTAAGAIAAALDAEKLLMITDVPGIMRSDAQGKQETIAVTHSAEIARLIADGIITGGMIPKVQAALDALAQGVREVVICRGNGEDFQTICSGGRAGTTITGVST